MRRPIAVSTAFVLGIICPSVIAFAFEAEGQSTYEGRTTTYKTAVAERVRKTGGDFKFHFVTVTLYPWSFSDEQKEKMLKSNYGGAVKRKELSEFIAAQGMTEGDHYVRLTFNLKDEEADFAAENIDWVTLTWFSLPATNSTSRLPAEAKLENFRVDKLEQGGTVSFDLKRETDGQKIAVRVKATIARSSVRQ